MVQAFIVMDRSLCKHRLSSQDYTEKTTANQQTFGAGTKYAAKLKNNIPEEAPPTPDTILEALENHIEKYNDAIDLARDRLHEQTGAYGRFTATNTVVIHDDLKRHASRVEAMGDQLTGDVSRVDGKADIMISNMRRMAVEDAAYREERRLQDEWNTAMVLEAFRGGARELRQLIVQDIVQEMQQADNRTLVMNSIIDSQSEFLRHPACSMYTPITSLTNTASPQNKGR
jgi:hypothetical protein